MKNIRLKLIAIAALILASVSTGYCQLPGDDMRERPKTDLFRAGVTFNINTNYNSFSGFENASSPIFGFGAGAIAQMRITDLLFVQAEAAYLNHGTKSAMGDVRLHSADLPVSAVFMTSPAQVRALLQFGGYINYSFAGSIDGNPIDWQSQKLNRIDYGYQAALGVEVENAQVKIGFRESLGDLFKPGSLGYGYTKNSTILLSLVYFFDWGN
jgi:hypothetical protein